MSLGAVFDTAWVTSTLGSFSASRHVLDAQRAQVSGLERRRARSLASISDWRAHIFPAPGSMRYPGTRLMAALEQPSVLALMTALRKWYVQGAREQRSTDAVASPFAFYQDNSV